MFFQIYGETAGWQLLGWLLVFAGLVVMNEIARRSKAGGIACFLILPAALSVYFIAIYVGAAMGADWVLNNDTYVHMNSWFHYAKLYAATAGCIGFMILKYHWGKLGKSHGFKAFPFIIVAINILIAVASDFESAVRAGSLAGGWWLSSEGVWLYGGWWNVLNGLAGILNIFCMTGWWGIYSSKDKKDMLWPDMIWVYVLAYDMLDMVNMAHLGPRAFEEIGGEVVQTTSFVLRNRHIEKFKGTYCRLTEPTTQQGKEKMFLDGENRYFAEQDNFSKIPGSPVAYWLSYAVYEVFSKSNESIKNFAFGEGKNVTTNNSKYILFDWEINKNDIGAFNYKWLPCAMGGDYRKWYGNIVNVIDWSSEARNFYKSNPAGRIIREEFWNMSGVTWGKISSASPSFRYLDNNQMYQETAVLQKNKNDTLMILSVLNTKVAQFFLSFLAPTLNFQLQDICAIPLSEQLKTVQTEAIEIGNKCVNESKNDWNAFEISLDFQHHPLFRKVSYISKAFDQWKDECDSRFNQLKSNEEELNHIFIDIYGLQDELTPEVEDKDITVRKADLSRDIRSFMSYAVGCMFGRYSLDEEGLIYAGGEWDNNRYKTFIPDEDNCIPITDEEYFSDDIVTRFVEFVKTVYGVDTLEENLDFIANALGNKGDTSREVIRNYFLKDFYADHLKVYQKRPIYWLFDSGKQNGFKALIYMHRYDADTVGRVRTDYLHRVQKYVETAMQSAQYTIDNASSASEKSKATKAVTKYTKQLAEMKIYDEAIAHIANKRIEIDLDDGVKVNYAKFQGVEVAQEGKKALKVDLLAKLK